jgi:hypothetical protein
MAMDRETAKVIAVAALRSSSELVNLIPILRTVCSDEEYEAWRFKIADTSAQITQGLLSAVLAEHPDLEAELDEHYRRFGRPG